MCFFYLTSACLSWSQLVQDFYQSVRNLKNPDPPAYKKTQRTKIVSGSRKEGGKGTMLHLFFMNNTKEELQGCGKKGTQTERQEKESATAPVCRVVVRRCPRLQTEDKGGQSRRVEGGIHLWFCVFLVCFLCFCVSFLHVSCSIRLRKLHILGEGPPL